MFGGGASPEQHFQPPPLSSFSSSSSWPCRFPEPRQVRLCPFPDPSPAWSGEKTTTRSLLTRRATALGEVNTGSALDSEQAACWNSSCLFPCDLKTDLRLFRRNSATCWLLIIPPLLTRGAVIWGWIRRTAVYTHTHTRLLFNDSSFYFMVLISFNDTI